MRVFVALREEVLVLIRRTRSGDLHRLSRTVTCGLSALDVDIDVLDSMIVVIVFQVCVAVKVTKK